MDLATKTNAQIVYSPTAKPDYKIISAEDGQIFEIGNYKIKVMHTPGHTLESTTYMLIDEFGKEQGIITGDTLFIGDVGKPDLAQHVVADLTQDKLARLLYHSLREKIMPLRDDLIVYPNHGAGSACGKMMSKETTDTLGNQKKTFPVSFFRIHHKHLINLDHFKLYIKGKGSLTVLLTEAILRFLHIERKPSSTRLNRYTNSKTNHLLKKKQHLINKFC